MQLITSVPERGTVCLILNYNVVLKSEPPETALPNSDIGRICPSQKNDFREDKLVRKNKTQTSCEAFKMSHQI